MASSYLAAIRNAVAGAADHALDLDDEDAGKTGAAAPLKKEEQSMSTDDTPAGGDKNAGISQIEHEKAVKAAGSEGEARGAAAATGRLAAALGADGVKGDGVRMAAAFDLAVKSPGMSGEDVAAFVVGNVAAGKPADADATAYEQQRLAAAGAAQPSASSGKKAVINTSAIYASRRKQSQEG